ncbi:MULTISPECIES: hypothetical protein [Psychrilyobacter]|uniref:Twin-arginine translocase TatA/TatE family subunit n=1 Tax=Psychrilyobacter piezotolerans TaxID=2293438 RepID=A0ABX9KFN6_9FUSO|nr:MULTISPECIES: hypothetical protein [Psychrilyobacter]MCS5422165.1 hypothetical protein [Psychrilyobacter sp. S5]NDI78512.1 hypothetical protein [Psychrilyobacter piezotolerans]RDE60477.1 hypothetical protein DV867_10855 [Psychrilyobacter sp. S5]REI40507.1 hypothetical protein DYH56_10855 [Psychrilyobacter piezotolerans]
MIELFTNPLVLQILFGIILLVLPSPLLKKTWDKVGDAIEGVGGEKARGVAYNFTEGLKNSKHDGDINLTSNDQIDRELDKYKI